MKIFNTGAIQVLVLRSISWFNRVSPVFVLAPYERAIGNAAEELYYGFRHARRTGKRILVVRPLSVFGLPTTCNKEIYELTTENSLKFLPGVFQFLAGLFLTIFFGQVFVTFRFVTINTCRLIAFGARKTVYVLSGKKTAKPRFVFQRRWHLYFPPQIGMEYLWNPGGKREFSYEEIGRVDWASEFTRPLEVMFHPDKEKLGRETLRAMGLGEKDWYVCLHVREGGYKGDAISTRNGDPHSFIKGIQAITAAGGWVIRLGDRSMTPLPAMERVIDYPFTNFKSDLMDLYLIKYCKFFWGHASGLLEVAHLFQKKLVCINLISLVLTAMRLPNGRFITKHVYSEEKKRFLSISELLDKVAGWPIDFHETPGFRVVDNTPDEILAAVLEGLSDAPPSLTPLQLQFNERQKLALRQWLKDLPQSYGVQEDSPELRSYLLEQQRLIGHQFRFAIQELYQKGSMSAGFLERNWHKDQTDPALYPECRPVNLI